MHAPRLFFINCQVAYVDTWEMPYVARLQDQGVSETIKDSQQLTAPPLQVWLLQSSRVNCCVDIIHEEQAQERPTLTLEFCCFQLKQIHTAQRSVFLSISSLQLHCNNKLIFLYQKTRCCKHYTLNIMTMSIKLFNKLRN